MSSSVSISFTMFLGELPLWTSPSKKKKKCSVFLLSCWCEPGPSIFPNKRSHLLPWDRWWAKSLASRVLPHPRFPFLSVLLLLLSHFSHVRLCVTPCWQPTRLPHPWDSPGKKTSGLPFPSPIHESKKWKWNPQPCPTLSDPRDCSPPGPSVHGIL